MSQQKNDQTNYTNENTFDLTAENQAADSPEQTNSEEIENLPIESIGSYARVEEVMTEGDESSKSSE